MPVDNLKSRNEVSTIGSIIEQNVNDTDAEALLTNILKELKIMNIHLSKLTDNILSYEDISDA